MNLAPKPQPFLLVVATPQEILVQQFRGEGARERFLEVLRKRAGK